MFLSLQPQFKRHMLKLGLQAIVRGASLLTPCVSSCNTYTELTTNNI